MRGSSHVTALDRGTIPGRTVRSRSDATCSRTVRAGVSRVVACLAWCTSRSSRDQRPARSHGDGLRLSSDATPLSALHRRAAIDVSVNDPADTKNRDAIRSHLPHITMMFGSGDFDAPMLVHDSKTVVVWAGGAGSWSAPLPGSVSFAVCPSARTSGPTSTQHFFREVCSHLLAVPGHGWMTR
jgi:hypothetical protein